MDKAFHDETTLLWVALIDRNSVGQSRVHLNVDAFLMLGKHPKYYLGTYTKDCADGIKQKIEEAKHVYIKALNGLPFNSTDFERTVHRLTSEVEQAIGC